MDWLAAVLSLAAVIFIARKRWWGWLIGAASSIVWMWVGWTDGRYGLIGSTCVFFCIELTTAWKWKKDDSLEG